MHPASMGSDASNFPVLKRGASSSLGTKSHRIPLFELRESWSNTGHAVRQRVSELGCVWPVCYLPGGDFLPLIYRQALAASSSLRDVKSQQDFPASSQKIDGAPVEPRPGITRDAQHHLLLAQGVKYTPWPFLLLWGCILDAPEWKTEGGGGEVGEGEGLRAEISPP